MVRRVRHRKSRRVGAAGSRGYKKCIISKLRVIKFKTPKAARKAFGRAAKMCRKKLAGKTTVRRRKSRRKAHRRKAHRRVGRKTTRRRTRRRAPWM